MNVINFVCLVYRSGWVDGAKCNKIGIGQSVSVVVVLKFNCCICYLINEMY